MKRALLGLAFLAAMTWAAAAAELGGLAQGLLVPDRTLRETAIRQLGDSGDTAAIAPLVHRLFFADDREQRAIHAALAALTGAQKDTWFAWQVWQEEHKDIKEPDFYDGWLAQSLSAVDPLFRRFIYPGMPHRIALSEIVWGGVRVDGIPALSNPQTTTAGEATWLDPQDRVFGVVVAGQARAYPLRIVDWHEMVNDEIGGQPVSLAYCTLCGAAILFDTRIPSAPPHIFGSSGLLYRSNKLMYDRATSSLWNQFTGEPVTGALAPSGITLPVLPVTATSWGAWRRLHPQTTVLSRNTGVVRNYAKGAAYGAYFASPALMFPASVTDADRQKDIAFGVRAPGGVKAWPLARFADGALVQDQVGLIDIVALADDAGGVRAYTATGRFTRTGPTTLRNGNGDWQVTEDALIGPKGETLPRVPGHLGYRFAWQGYFGDAVLSP
jgi:hypothetical protein